MSSVDEIATRLPLGGIGFSGSAIQTGSTFQSELQPGALEPTWIMEGAPKVGSLGLTTTNDGLFTCGLWECTAGKFKYIFGCDEIVHILEGEVTVQEVDATGAAGAEYTLRPGDVAFFHHGLTTYWTVPHYVKKFAIHRTVEYSLPGRIVKKLKRIFKR